MDLGGSQELEMRLGSHLDIDSFHISIREEGGPIPGHCSQGGKEVGKKGTEQWKVRSEKEQAGGGPGDEGCGSVQEEVEVVQRVDHLRLLPPRSKSVV